MKISIAGFGSVCENAHIPAIKNIANLKISGVFDLSKDRREHALSFINTVVYDNFDEMLEKESPDVLLITTPPSSHKEYILKALNKGIDVLCEKPLCIKLADFDEIADISRGKKRVVYTVHNWKYSDALKKIIEISRDIAPIKYLSWTTMRKKPSSAVMNWRIDPSISGGGIIFDHGWHVFYILREIFLSDFYDIMPYFVFNERRVDEVADLKIIYKNDGIANVHLSWLSPSRKNSCICYGENGWFEFVDDKIFYETKEGSGVYVFDEKISSSSAHPLWTEFVYKDFLISLNDRELFEKNLEEASQCIRIIDKAYRRFNIGG